eukprot:GDKI01006236.1.p2 GENE.GDKI01006236.1~~GDKI01006236.1.p2  ORF type:complete len:236 (+),score=17.03 GDKI01006236.1:645-1352(+)
MILFLHTCAKFCNEYVLRPRSYWPTELSDEHKVEDESFRRVQPLLDGAGVNVTYPEDDDLPYDQIWEYAGVSFRVQFKTMGWRKDRYTAVCTLARHDGTDQATGQKKGRPYVEGEADLYCFVSPADTHPKLQFTCDNFVHIVGEQCLKRNGRLVVTDVKGDVIQKGVRFVSVFYPSVISSVAPLAAYAARRKRLCDSMDPFLYDLLDTQKSASALAHFLSECATRVRKTDVDETN